MIRSDKEWVLSWLRTGKPITPRDAYELRGCYRLGARIYDLRAEGYQIVTEMIEAKDRRGNRVRYASYKLKDG